MGKRVCHPGERTTWYAVASCWTRNGQGSNLVVGSHLFSVVGDNPLTREEAWARAAKYHDENWDESKFGKRSEFTLQTQSLDISVTYFTVGE